MADYPPGPECEESIFSRSFTKTPETLLVAMNYSDARIHSMEDKPKPEKARALIRSQIFRDRVLL